MYEYFVHERELNNLIWVLCYTGSPDAAWYPGDEYVDIAGADTYNVGNSPQTNMYNKVKTITNDQFPIAYHECGVPPHPDKCLSEGSMWSWWMQWHTSHLQNTDLTYLKFVYDHDLVITLDEVPDIMASYGWDQDSCDASEISPHIRIDDGNWEQTSAVTLDICSTVSFKASTQDSGSFSWSGYGTSGSDPEQSSSFQGTGIATVTFINACHATSTQSFTIIQDCQQTEIIPFIQVDGGVPQYTREITITRGSTVVLSPQPETGGNWEWMGSGISSTEREITITSDSSFSVTAKYTNYCGTPSSRIFNVTVNPDVTAARLQSSNHELVLSPVPCKSHLKVNLYDAVPGSASLISIYNMQGSLVYTDFTTLNEFTINTDGLAPDIYLLKAVNDNFILSGSFVKKQ